MIFVFRYFVKKHTETDRQTYKGITRPPTPVRGNYIRTMSLYTERKAERCEEKESEGKKQKERSKERKKETDELTHKKKQMKERVKDKENKTERNRQNEDRRKVWKPARSSKEER